MNQTVKAAPVIDVETREIATRAERRSPLGTRSDWRAWRATGGPREMLVTLAISACAAAIYLLLTA